MINVSPNAVQEINRLKSSSEQPQPYLRVTVSQGGCADFFYQLSFDTQVNQGDRQFIIEDSDIILITDEQTCLYIENLTIDYTEDLMGGAFQYKNPLAIKQCTCGNSFSLQ